MFGGKQKRKGNTKILSVCVIKCQIQVLRDVCGGV